MTSITSSATTAPLLSNPVAAIDTSAPLSALRYENSVDDAIQIARYEEIVFREKPYVLRPENNQLSSIEFTIPELLNFLTEHLGPLGIIKENPWLVGGAAGYVLTGLAYAD